MAPFGLAPWLLAIGAAVGFAVYTVILEYGLGRATTPRSPVLAGAFYSTVIVTAGFWALALANGIPPGTLTLGAAWPFLLAGVAYPAVFRFLYFGGIDRVGSSITAAVMGAYPAVSVGLAVLLLGQRLGLLAGLGLALIVAGAVILQLTRESADAEAVRDVVTERLVRATPGDLLYPLAATVFAGAAFVLIDFGLGRFPDPILATALTQTPAVILFTGWALLAGAGSGQLRVGRIALGAFVLGASVNLLAWLSNFFALQAGTVVTVVPLLNTMPLVILAIRYGLERRLPRSPRILMAVLAIVAGASLIQIGT